MTGLAAGAIVVLVLPLPLGAALGLIGAGGGLIGAGWLTEKRREREREMLLAGLGEVKVRLAANAIRIDGLGQRLDQMPMAAGEAAPTRAAISELTAEVGLLGDLMQQIASAVGDHDERLQAGERARQPAAKTAPAARGVTPPAMARPAPETRPTAAPAPIAPPAPAAERPPEPPAGSGPRITPERLAMISAALADGRVEIHLQPIVQLPQRRTRGYEALVRLRLDEATLLQPADFLTVVEERGFGPTLDALVLTRALAIARHLGTKEGAQFVSCNFSRATWGSSRALATLSRILERYREHVGQLVVEMPQAVFRALDPASLGLLGAMSATGVRFALDQVGDLRFDPAGFHDRGIRFVKVPAALLLAGDGGRRQSDIAVGDLAALLARASVTLVAERVETDQMAADMIELGIDHAQGFAFARPRPVKPEIFAEPAAPTAAAAPAEPPPIAPEPPLPKKPASPERLPFRAVLRRAAG